MLIGIGWLSGLLDSTRMRIHVLESLDGKKLQDYWTLHSLLGYELFCCINMFL